MALLRSLSKSFILAVLMGAVASGSPVQRQDVKKAKRYVAEVKKHLLESYINKDRMDKDQLEDAGLRALVKAAKSDELRSELRACDSLNDALDVADEHDFDGVDALVFADHATRAMVKLTGDPFSRILTDKDFAKLMKMMGGGARDQSLGLGVAMEKGKAKVVFVQYGYVAYEAGIETGDEVLSINGTSIRKIKPGDFREKLKAEAGQTVTVTVRREGIDRDLAFKLKQRNVKPKDVHFSMIKGGIGYLRMTIFDLKLVKEVKKALGEMKEKGMKACILDLRNNPGGALPACTGVADLFLDQGLLITKTVSFYTPSIGGFKLKGMGGDQQFKTKKESEFEKIPLVLLINGSSASASEMLAGAMQDHQRATLIGETTYGKGVGQSPIFLSSVFQKRYLYLTIMRYTTPKGSEVHHVGIAPKIGFRNRKLSSSKFIASWELRESGRLDRYLDRYWDDQEELLRELATYDGFETDRYPGFDRLFQRADSGLTRDEFRRELRLAIRRRIVEESGVPFVYDIQTDLQLQRGVVELLDKLGDE